MVKPEILVETCLQQVRGWLTIANIRQGASGGIELLALDLAARRKYHVESGLSGPNGQAHLSARPADYARPQWRAERTIGHFIEHRFEAAAALYVLSQLGFVPGTYRKVIVSLGWTPEAKAAADEAGIELWDFREIVRELGASIATNPAAFSKETAETVFWFSTYPERNPASELPGSDEVVIQSRAFWHFERWTFALIEPAETGVTLWALDDTGRVLDELPCATPQEAEAKLQRNGFQPYDPDDPVLTTWVVAPRPPFRRLTEPVRLFSSGSWK